MDKKLPKIAERYVEQKLGQLRTEAGRFCGNYYEIYLQNYTDKVDGLVEKIKRPELKKHFLHEAKKGDEYVEGGRWHYDELREDVFFHESPKVVFDPSADPVRKPEERAAERWGAKNVETVKSPSRKIGPLKH